MAFLDIERIINKENVGSRFKLVHLAGQRAKELNAPKDSTYITSSKANQKVTSRALSDLIYEKIDFEEQEIDDIIEEEVVMTAPEEIVMTLDGNDDDDKDDELNEEEITEETKSTEESE